LSLKITIPVAKINSTPRITFNKGWNMQPTYFFICLLNSKKILLFKFFPLTASIIGLRILKSNRGLISFQIACMHKKAAAACNLICTAAVCASLQNNWPAQRAALLQSAERQRGDAVRRSIDQHARVPGVFFTPDSVVASRI
jgi:hypothetical protein